MLVCPICEFQSGGEEGLVNHIRHQHTDYETFYAKKSNYKKKLKQVTTNWVQTKEVMDVRKEWAKKFYNEMIKYALSKVTKQFEESKGK